MTSPARRVRRLRLAADSRAAVQRVLPALEDALRTASLPDAGGRLLLVRRLALGRIPADAAPSTLALALEQAVAKAEIDCLPAEARGAAAAAAVWFRDALHAHTALALRLLEGPPPDEWFWPLAVPAWSPGDAPAEALQAIARALAGRPEAAAAGPAWRAALAARGHAARLPSAAGEGAASPGPTPSPVPRLATLRPVPTGARPAPATGLDGDRTDTPVPVDWAAPASSPVPSAATPPRRDLPPSAATPAALPVPVSAPAAAAAIHADLPSPVGTTPTAPPPPTLPTAAPAPPETSFRAPRAPEALRPPPAIEAAAESAAEPLPRASRLALAALEQAPYRGLPTAAGGLAFVLPVLARLGLPAWLGPVPEPDRAAQRIAAGVLGAVLQRLAVAADDPAWALAAVADRRPVATLPALPPAAWALLARRDGGRPLVFDDAVDAGPREAQAVALWTRAVHRWLRRHARLGLPALVRRPALLALTPTHLDVRHDLSGVDLRIRRAGLDLDPGWLPWFGRVVGFHYERLAP